MVVLLGCASTTSHILPSSHTRAPPRASVNCTAFGRHPARCPGDRGRVFEAPGSASTKASHGLGPGESSTPAATVSRLRRSEGAARRAGVTAFPSEVRRALWPVEAGGPDESSRKEVLDGLWGWSRVGGGLLREWPPDRFHAHRALMAWFSASGPLRAILEPNKRAQGSRGFWAARADLKPSSVLGLLAWGCSVWGCWLGESRGQSPGMAPRLLAVGGFSFSRRRLSGSGVSGRPRPGFPARSGAVFLLLII